MNWRELALNLALALLVVVAFLVALAVIPGCASAPPGGGCSRPVDCLTAAPVHCVCRGAP